MKRAALVVGLLALLPISVVAQSATNTQSFTAAGTDASPTYVGGYNTCSLQVSGTWTGFIVTPKASSDNGQTYPQTITTIGGGSITANGNYSGTIAGRANTTFEYVVSGASPTGTITITKACNVQLSSVSLSAGSTSAPQYTRLQDGSSTNLAAISAAGAVSIQTSSATVTLNPTVTASSAYSSGNEVGPLLSFSSAFRAANSGVLESIAISVKSTQSNAYKLYVFSANPSNSTWSDKTTPAINAADKGLLLGVYSLANYDNGMGTSTVYNLDGIGKQITSSSTTLYAVLVTTSAVTFASTSDVFVSVGVLQD